MLISGSIVIATSVRFAFVSKAFDTGNFAVSTVPLIYTTEVELTVIIVTWCTASVWDYFEALNTGYLSSSFGAKNNKRGGRLESVYHISKGSSGPGRRRGSENSGDRVLLDVLTQTDIRHEILDQGQDANSDDSRISPDFQASRIMVTKAVAVETEMVHKAFDRR